MQVDDGGYLHVQMIVVRISRCRQRYGMVWIASLVEGWIGKVGNRLGRMIDNRLDRCTVDAYRLQSFKDFVRYRGRNRNAGRAWDEKVVMELGLASVAPIPG